MFDMLSKKQRKQSVPLISEYGKMPVSGGTKQLTIAEKEEYYSYIDELTGEAVMIRRTVRTESRERITVTRRSRG